MHHLEAVGAALPAAVAIALSPFPIIGIVLIVSGPRGRTNGLIFALGWLVGLTALVALVVGIAGGADDPDSTTSTIASWGRVIAGAGLMAFGVRKWWRRPRAGDETETPAWMASLGDATSRRSLVLGVVLSGLNPKNVVLSASAATSMIEAGADSSGLVVAASIFVVVASSTVIGAVVATVFGGPRAASALDRVREYMVANSAVISMVVLMILGAKVLGDGLSGLGR